MDHSTGHSDISEENNTVTTATKAVRVHTPSSFKQNDINNEPEEIGPREDPYGVESNDEAGNDDEDTSEKRHKTEVKSGGENVEINLDWNRIFRFLANQLDAGKWRLFFNTLYCNSQKRGDITAKLNQVEQDAKQRGVSDIVTLLMEQFYAWKQYTGRNAQHTVIYLSLEELEWNDTLDKFKAFMMNPPELSSNDYKGTYVTEHQSQLSGITLPLALPRNANMPLPEPTNATVKTHTNDPILSRHSCFPPPYCRIKCERSFQEFFTVENGTPQQGKPFEQHRGVPDGVSEILSTKHDEKETDKTFDQKQEPSIIAGQYHETQELTETGGSSVFQKRANLSSDITKQKKKYSKCKKTKTGKHLKAHSSSLYCKLLSISSYHKLIKSYLQFSETKLERDMYQLFLQGIITKVVKETKHSEKVILSLKCAEYHDADELKTKKETIYTIYHGKKRLVLGESVYKEMQIYTDKARQQVVDRLGGNIDRENQKYLFIDYDGKCCHSQNATNEMEDETCSDDSVSITIESTQSMSDDD